MKMKPLFVGFLKIVITFSREKCPTESADVSQSKM